MNQLTSGVRARHVAPPYQRIEELLRSRIADGVWAVGSKIPSRKDLSREFSVAIATIERAISALLADGTLQADGARGTFVSRECEEAQADGHARHPDDVEERAVAASTIPIWRPLSRMNATLGIVAPFIPVEQHNYDAAGFWIRTIVNGLEQVFSAGGGTTRVFNTHRPNQKLARGSDGASALLSEGVDAIVVILEDNPREIEAVVAVADRRETPIVFITSEEIRRPLVHVFYDNEDAGYQAAAHLLQRGRRDLVFLAPYDTTWAKERIKGARSAVMQARLPHSALQVFPATQIVSPLLEEEISPHSPELLANYHDLGYRYAGQLFVEQPDSKAIITADDYLGQDVIRVAVESGKGIGSDVAVVGFDDSPESRLVGLTSLRPPLEALGQEAARLVLRALSGENADLQVRLRSHLLPRASTQTEASAMHCL